MIFIRLKALSDFFRSPDELLSVISETFFCFISLMHICYISVAKNKNKTKHTHTKTTTREQHRFYSNEGIVRSPVAVNIKIIGKVTQMSVVVSLVTCVTSFERY